MINKVLSDLIPPLSIDFQEKRAALGKNCDALQPRNKEWRQEGPQCH